MVKCGLVTTCRNPCFGGMLLSTRPVAPGSGFGGPYVAILVLVECCCLQNSPMNKKPHTSVSQSLFWWNVVVYSLAEGIDELSKYVSQSLFWWNVVVYVDGQKKLIGQKAVSQSLFWWNVVVYKKLIGQKAEDFWICRNPCFGGMLLSTKVFPAVRMYDVPCRNPCFGGMLLSTNITRNMSPISLYCRNPCFGSSLMSS